MGSIKNAVILAAGLGSRLKPMTYEEPKCFTEVNGKTIIEQLLAALEKNGIKNTVIVVGYLGHIIQKRLGDRYGNMTLSYIESKVYKETNSMYSAWLARHTLEKGALLIEGDTVFDEILIEKALNSDEDKSYWVLDRFRPEYDGSLCIGQPGGRIEDHRIVRGKLSEYKDTYFKSTGVLKVTSGYGKLFSKWLDRYVQENDVKIYYDIVIARHLKDAPLYILDITGTRWFEIDTPEDLVRAEQILQPKRYAVIIIDGAADEPVPELDNKTPLEYSNMLTLDYLTKRGHTGLLKTCYDGLPVCSIVANLGIIGYNPWRYYPNGRASLEALAQEIYLNPGDIAFRCNLITVDEGVLTDFTAQNIPSKIAHPIVKKLNEEFDEFELYVGQSYRNTLILRSANIDVSKLKMCEPHENIGKPIEMLWPRGADDESQTVAEKLKKMMVGSKEILERMNRERSSAATMIFPWSASIEPKLPSFHRKFNNDGAIVCGLDFMRGIGMAARMECKKILGATGYNDTDLEAKLLAAKNALRYNELAYIHINAPDEEAHMHNAKGKVAILEKIDRQVIKPLMEHLEENYLGNYRIAVLPDHYTTTKDGRHGIKPVPYVILGHGIDPDIVERFTEKEIEQNCKSLLKSYEFMDFLLRI